MPSYAETAMAEDRCVPFPAIEGVRFRRFSGPSDFEAMSTISHRSWLADGFEWVRSVEEIEGTYREISSRDPLEDLILIEAGSEIIGYGEISSDWHDSSNKSFWNFVYLLPDWRIKGIREAVLRYNELRLLDRARRDRARGFFQTWACQEPNDWRSLIERNGYSVSWSQLEMEHSHLESVPLFPLPAGLEVRPVPPERYRDVWEGMKEAYRDERWYSEILYDEEHFRAWPTRSDFEPELWQVAWEGDRIVGAVQNYVDKEANRLFDRRVGHTEGVFVVADWRNRGVAKALISRSLRMHAHLGMTKASLDVTTHNVSGALQLYTSLGYRPVHAFGFFRKPLPNL